jgi:hypothetical protein
MSSLEKVPVDLFRSYQQPFLTIGVKEATPGKTEKMPVSRDYFKQICV